jgi:hypothetical protein
MAEIGTAQPRGPRLKLSHKQRKTVLLLHILASSVWIGVDILTAVLVGTGLLDGHRTLAVYQALGGYVLVPTLVAAAVAGVVSLASGLLLGAGTKWGIVRHWWVAVKLVLNVVLGVAVVIILLPVLQIAGGQRGLDDVTPLFTLALVALALLVFADVLSIFKPWGRVRRASPQQPAMASAVAGQR